MRAPVSPLPQRPQPKQSLMQLPAPQPPQLQQAMQSLIKPRGLARLPWMVFAQLPRESQKAVAMQVGLLLRLQAG